MNKGRVLVKCEHCEQCHMVSEYTQRVFCNGCAHWIQIWQMGKGRVGQSERQIEKGAKTKGG